MDEIMVMVRIAEKGSNPCGNALAIDGAAMQPRRLELAVWASAESALIANISCTVSAPYFP